MRKTPGKSPEVPGPGGRAGRVVDVGRTDPEVTRRNILDVAQHEFASKGLEGARIDEIADRTNTSKRMIYYYFGSKEGLYIAVLERCYVGIRQMERLPDMERLTPAEALRTIVEVSFDYHVQHPDFVRLVMSENIAYGAHIEKLNGIKTRNSSVVEVLGNLLQRGHAEGVFRDRLDPVDLHMSISALCFYYVSNAHTFSRIFSRDMSSAAAIARRRSVVADTVLRWCLR